MSGLRQQLTAATRQAIIEAFLQLAHTSNSSTVSMPAVAAEAGVSVRTVYRYFPTKDDLQTAAAYRFADDALGYDIDEITAENWEASLANLWRHFESRLPAIIAEHTTPAGRAFRAERLVNARERFRAANDDPLGDDLVDLLVALSSSSMFLELVDRMGHTPEHAAAMVTKLGFLALESNFTVGGDDHD